MRRPAERHADGKLMANWPVALAQGYAQAASSPGVSGAVQWVAAVRVATVLIAAAGL